MIPRSLSLTRAVADGNTEAVRDLLAQGADANRTTSGGQTPLILAIVFRHIHILRLLLEAGADPQLRDSLGLNAIDWAQRKGFTEGVTLLAQSRSAKHDTSPSVHSTAPTVPNQSVSRNVEEENPQPGKAPGQMRSDEKTRQWIAGLKRRFDEEAGRKAKEVQPTPPPPTTETKAYRVPINDRPIRASTRPPEPLVIPEKVIMAPSPHCLPDVASET